MSWKNKVLTASLGEMKRQREINAHALIAALTKNAVLTLALAESRGQNKNWESAFGVKSLQEAISKFKNALTTPAPPQQEMP